PLLYVSRRIANSSDAIDNINCQSEAVDLVSNCEFERRVDVALLFITAHVDIGVIRASISEFMNQPWIAVEIEDHGLVLGEQRIEIAIRKPVGMLCIGS